MLNAAKDAMTSRAAQAWANNLIASYGKVQDLKIDSRRKTIEVTCLLEGETSAITVRVGSYTIETEGDRKFIRATGFSCTRPWLQKVLADHGPGRRLELPPWAVAVL